MIASIAGVGIEDLDEDPSKRCNWNVQDDGIPH